MSKELILSHQKPAGSCKRRISAAKAQMARYVPRTTKQGFADGRARGRKFAEQDFSYGIGATIGFGFGVCETVVEALATPMNWLVAAVSADSTVVHDA